MFDLPTGTTSVQVVLKMTTIARMGNDFVVDDLSLCALFPTDRGFLCQQFRLFQKSVRLQ